MEFSQRCLVPGGTRMSQRTWLEITSLPRLVWFEFVVGMILKVWELNCEWSITNLILLILCCCFSGFLAICHPNEDQQQQLQTQQQQQQNPQPATPTPATQQFANVDRYVEIASALCIKEWRRLPHVVSHIHLTFLQAAQQVMELQVITQCICLCYMDH